MIQYIIDDLRNAMGYLIYGVIVGIVVALFLLLFNQSRVKRRQKPLRIVPITCLVMYVVVILCITFLSRELGSRARTVDLQLFGSWGRTNKTHAFVVENVLLFVPYGFLVGCNVTKPGNLFSVVWIGFLSSLAIESMQLLTARGYFQIDDVLTNTIGMLIGGTIWLCCFSLHKRTVTGKERCEDENV